MRCTPQCWAARLHISIGRRNDISGSYSRPVSSRRSRRCWPYLGGISTPMLPLGIPLLSIYISRYLRASRTSCLDNVLPSSILTSTSVATLLVPTSTPSWLRFSPLLIPIYQEVMWIPYLKSPESCEATSSHRRIKSLLSLTVERLTVTERSAVPPGATVTCRPPPSLLLPIPIVIVFVAIA